MHKTKWLQIAAVLAATAGPAFAADGGAVDTAALARLIEQQSKQLEAQQQQLQALTEKLKQVEASTAETKQLKKELQETNVALAQTNDRVDNKIQLGKGIDGLKITGDARIRAETASLGYAKPNAANTKNAKDFSRFRERLRVGGVWTNKAENWEIGAGLATGNDPNGRTGNSDWGQDTKGAYDRLNIWLDYGYAKHKWNWDGTPVSLTLGKQKSGFVTSRLNWADDLRPEGLTLQYGNPQEEKYYGAFATLGGYQVQYLTNGATTAADGSSYLQSFGSNVFELHGQTGYRYKGDDGVWLGAVGYQKITNGFKDTSGGLYQKSQNPGFSGGKYTDYDYDIFDAYTEYKTTLGGFEVKPYAHLAYNAGATGKTSQQKDTSTTGSSNLGWLLGADVKRDQWTFGYGYAYIGADSVFGPFRDTGFGYTSGLQDTDLQGHVFRLGYDVTKNFNLGATWYLLNRIEGGSKDNKTVNSPDTSSLVQLDAVYKF